MTAAWVGAGGGVTTAAGVLAGVGAAAGAGAGAEGVELGVGANRERAGAAALGVGLDDGNGSIVTLGGTIGVRAAGAGVFGAGVGVGVGLGSGAGDRRSRGAIEKLSRPGIVCGSAVLPCASCATAAAAANRAISAASDTRRKNWKVKVGVIGFLAASSGPCRPDARIETLFAIS